MNMKLPLMAVALILVGCNSPNYLTERYNLPRADLTEQPVEVTHNPPAAADKPMVNDDPTGQTPPAVPNTIDVITGTWTFTTPPTTTRVERRNADVATTSIYNGRPKPTDRPVVVITISPEEPGSTVESDPAKYKTAGTRKYILNGTIASEWTGRTSDGNSFCELIVKRPGGGGDTLHAMAIAKDAESRKLALDILGSITWKPSAEPASNP